MSHDSALTTLPEESCVGKLAQLFPHASPLRIPVRLITLRAGRKRLEEQTVVEFGTPNEVVFASNLPLEFEERIRLVSQDRSLSVQATVVAVRYHEGSKAVAARFAGEVENWILKP